MITLQLALPATKQPKPNAPCSQAVDMALYPIDCIIQLDATICLELGLPANPTATACALSLGIVYDTKGAAYEFCGKVYCCAIQQGKGCRINDDSRRRDGGMSKLTLIASM